MTRIQLHKRKTKGWDIIEYKPKFGGHKVHGVFDTEKEAKKYAKKKGWL